MFRKVLSIVFIFTFSCTWQGKQANDSNSEYPKPNSEYPKPKYEVFPEIQLSQKFIIFEAYYINKPEQVDLIKIEPQYYYEKVRKQEPDNFAPILIDIENKKVYIDGAYQGYSRFDTLRKFKFYGEEINDSKLKSLIDSIQIPNTIFKSPEIINSNFVIGTYLRVKLNDKEFLAQLFDSSLLRHFRKDKKSDSLIVFIDSLQEFSLKATRAHNKIRKGQYALNLLKYWYKAPQVEF